MQQSYAFLMNVRSLLDAPKFQLAEGCELRRANNDEIEDIKGTINRLNTGTFSDNRLWEDRLEPVDPASLPKDYRLRVNRLDSARLPKEEWRYHVVAFHDNIAILDTDILDELTTAFDLSHVELEVGFTIVHSDIAGGPKEVEIVRKARLFHVLEAAAWTSDFLVDVSTADVSEIRSIHTKLRSYDHSVLDLNRLPIQMSHLKGLPHDSPLRFLGYFSIVESLLTHKPNPKDPYDSITRQVKKKLALLDRRFVRAIDYGEFTAAPEKVWTTMYDYRSVVAHGGMPDFKKDLVVLKSSNHALRLLKETTKALIRHALSEPQLIVDLREC